MSENLTPLEPVGADLTQEAPAAQQPEAPIEHIVTADDLLTVPELKEAGVEEGETILLHPEEKLTEEQVAALSKADLEAAGVTLVEENPIDPIPAGEAATLEAPVAPSVDEATADAIAPAVPEQTVTSQFVPSKEEVQLNGLPKGDTTEIPTAQQDTLTSQAKETSTEAAEFDGRPWLNPNNP